MSWFTSDENQRKAIAEIEQSKSDRASAIVAAAFVERDLRNSIEVRLRSNKNLIEKLFKPSGALGAFETKADLGYLLGIYDNDTHADICNIAWIRNRIWRRSRRLSGRPRPPHDKNATCGQKRFLKSTR